MSKNQRLAELIKQYTSLSSEDLAVLLETAEEIETNPEYEAIDVFIDVYNDLTSEGLVVYHKRPKDRPSLYKRDIVGEDALLENEPGAMRTLQTGMNSETLTAISQENVLILQSVYPIVRAGKTIGVKILERDFKKESQEHHSQILHEVDYIESLEVLKYLNEGFVNQLNEAILVFNSQGYLLNLNEEANKLYQKLGYKDNLIYMHYDNLSLDYTTFAYTMYQLSLLKDNEPIEMETAYFNYYFRVKKIWITKGQQLMVIIQDDTEVKSKEAEIISKSVAMREIHHRVKNNLQSVVSLLRIQERRSSNADVKKTLRETVTRIMAIATSHELLSKQVEDSVTLYESLEAVTFNFRHIFQNSKNVTLTLDVDRDIIISSDYMVTISLVVNELLQNIFDHAFLPNQAGEVLITGKRKNNLISISVADNGVGYDTSAKHSESLGLLIINSYVKDKLKGKLKIESGKQGTKTCFIFDSNNIEVVRN